MEEASNNVNDQVFVNQNMVAMNTVTTLVVFVNVPCTDLGIYWSTQTFNIANLHKAA